MQVDLTNIPTPNLPASNLPAFKEHKRSRLTVTDIKLATKQKITLPTDHHNLLHQVTNFKLI